MPIRNCWTCGSLTYRLKDTARRLADGSYIEPSAEHIFKDYQFSVNHTISLSDLAPEKRTA